MTLIKQLEAQLKELFESRNDSYKNTIVKEAYKKLPKSNYPMVTIEEIDNSEIEDRTTAQGEQTTKLSYQIVCYSRDTEEFEYVESARFMGNIVNNYIMEHYKMRRLGTPVSQPYLQDNTVMTCIQRYGCVYDKETNLIYKN
jgi:hypothetical protein